MKLDCWVKVSRCASATFHDNPLPCLQEKQVNSDVLILTLRVAIYDWRT